ncbi:putative clathrin assembly protein At1g25240 [Arachis duranensis]|uniref:Clathrin assembly protein At1g25240 n=1 Tax=Arachis duranensis TaxID=130453 RepID=A0A6P4CWN5_ARADU|nr:putative clathrin assembly protein At1g25240 [Arachis duranensis]
MRLWQKATGAIKDRKSIWTAKLMHNGPYQNPIFEAVVIKATSHDEHCIDCKNVQRVFQWLRTSPLHLKPLLFALSFRMEKTKNWVVAIKGLMLMHGVFCTNIAAVQKMGRLPFDFSNFSDGYLHPSKAWGFNSFVRAYFNYLDQRSAFVSSEFKRVSMKNNKKDGLEVEETLMEELKMLQNFQALIDSLLHIKPRNESMKQNALILEAMDCVIVEIFDVYSKFCKRMANVLMRIYDVGGREEAAVALKVLQKASSQGEDLSCYFKFCKVIGVLNASQCPKIERISDEDIEDLERIISSGDNMAIVLSDSCMEKELKTVITEQWEVFDDVDDYSSSWQNKNPFLDSSYDYSLVCQPPPPPQVLPDLISF